MSQKMQIFLHNSQKYTIFAAILFTNNSKTIMQNNFLPSYIGIAMTKSQFCFSTGTTPYKLKQTIKKNAKKYERLGLRKYDKLLMPIVVAELLSDTKLRINVDYYAQYIDGQRGGASPLEQ